MEDPHYGRKRKAVENDLAFDLDFSTDKNVVKSNTMSARRPFLTLFRVNADEAGRSSQSKAGNHHHCILPSVTGEQSNNTPMLNSKHLQIVRHAQSHCFYFPIRETRPVCIVHLTNR